jgi:hypothetical protein
MDTAAVNRVFRAQHGVISLAQARTSGMSERQILHRVDLSQWLRVHAKVFRHAVSPRS